MATRLQKRGIRSLAFRTGTAPVKRDLSFMRMMRSLRNVGIKLAYQFVNGVPYPRPIATSPLIALPLGPLPIWKERKMGRGICSSPNFAFCNWGRSGGGMSDP